MPRALLSISSFSCLPRLLVDLHAMSGFDVAWAQQVRATDEDRRLTFETSVEGLQRVCNMLKQLTFYRN